MVDVVRILVANLEVCDRSRVREKKPKEGSDIVQEYAEAYECGLIVEPLDVFREKGTERYIVADGEHRLLALRRAKIKEVECRLHEGDEIAALDFALGCNHAHGLRRTKADLYHAFARIKETSLNDKYRTDSDKSEKLGVSLRTIERFGAEWRKSEGGNARVREAKKNAQESADKHSGRAKAVSSNTVNPPTGGLQKSDSQGKSGNRARTEPAKTPDLTPEQKRVAKEVRESPGGRPPAPKPTVSAAQKMSFSRMLACSRDLPAPADLVAAGTRIVWDDIEQLNEWTGALLALRNV